VTRRRPLALLLLAGTAAAVLGSRAVAELGGEPPPSPVIYPRQTLPLSFSHVQHLTLEKLDCAFCHEQAPGSTSSADHLIPAEEPCTICHEIERDQPDKAVAAGQPDARCESCHPGWRGPGPGGARPPRVVVPPPNLKFNHKVHVDRRIRCQTCHGDLVKAQVGLATRNDLPRMATCLGCHNGVKAPHRCTTCHLSDPGGRVKVDFDEGLLVPSGSLRGDAHDLRFRTDHQRVGKTDAAYCASCHQTSFCTGCHDGVQKPLDFHGNDYGSTHPIDARRNQPDCSACHRRQTFCTGCHARAGVTTDDRTGEFTRVPNAIDPANPTGNLFHPRGWFTAPRGGVREPDHHSFQAQRNLRACASCHREELCIRCHGGAGAADGQIDAVNPHPLGWKRSARCRALAARAGRMCLRCHLDAADAACD
jgi:hypothetical protein